MITKRQAALSSNTLSVNSVLAATSFNTTRRMSNLITLGLCTWGEDWSSVVLDPDCACLLSARPEWRLSNAEWKGVAADFVGTDR